ncbi:MBL fold metallo-hydrolase [Actinomyces sp. B33]|uniref:MBL fold metallo-hydrolase n=1 Tax=Actinomyces sp. B33 TaxID=2942131 RepID=UPI0023419916|nr:MBL fold metallo-hydrolase [Actinomyces sp. B33]MDC4233854.1 MBL fold metallo-hydrolase [Actinomyces sp. B33]
MRLTIIGCTGSMSGPASPASCYLVQATGVDPATGARRVYSVALDLGPGSFGALWRHLDPRDLDAVHVSHGHADHIGDIISLQVHRRWGPGRGAAPVLVAGPAGTAERVRQIDGTTEPDGYEDEFSFLTLVDSTVYEVGPMRLTAAAGRHSVESYGVRIEGPDEADPSRTVSMFYTGDTDEAESIVRGARGVDLLLSEVGFTCADAAEGIHMNGVRAGSLAARAGAGRLVATHIQPWTDRAVVEAELRSAWSGPLDFAQSGQVYEVGAGRR